MQFSFGAVIIFAAHFLRVTWGESPLDPKIMIPTAEPTASSVCFQPRETGACRAKIPMWYYDADLGRCEEFIWGGCQGSENKFPNREACIRRCQPDVCLQPAVTGVCRANIRMWYYDSELRLCKEFSYGGCEGNENKFPTESHCQTACSGANAPCELGNHFSTVGWKAVYSNFRQTEWFTYRCEGRCRELCIQDSHPWGTCQAFSIRRKWYKCSCYLFDRYLSEMDLVQNTKGITRNRQCVNDKTNDIATNDTLPSV